MRNVHRFTVATLIKRVKFSLYPSVAFTWKGQGNWLWHGCFFKLVSKTYLFLESMVDIEETQVTSICHHDGSFVLVDSDPSWVHLISSEEHQPGTWKWLETFLQSSKADFQSSKTVLHSSWKTFLQSSCDLEGCIFCFWWANLTCWVRLALNFNPGWLYKYRGTYPPNSWCHLLLEWYHSNQTAQGSYVSYSAPFRGMSHWQVPPWMQGAMLISPMEPEKLLCSKTGGFKGIPIGKRT